MSKSFLVIRQTSDDQLRICPVPAGFRPTPQRGYVFGGPFPTVSAAKRAIRDKDETLRKQLYSE